MKEIIDITNNIAMYCYKNNLNFIIENNIGDNNGLDNYIKKIESDVTLSINKTDDDKLLSILEDFFKELN